MKNKRELNSSLKGSTLGDVDPDVDDVRKWVKQSKKKQKELALAAQRQKEIENMDNQFQDDAYTESE